MEQIYYELLFRKNTVYGRGRVTVNLLATFEHQFYPSVLMFCMLLQFYYIRKGKPRECEIKTCVLK